MTPKKQSLLIVACLVCTYLIWGSTYLAIKFAIESFPPLVMVATRFSIAGALLYVVLRVMGQPNPNFAQWRGAALVGFLLPVLGNGTVSYVQLTVSSSVAALAIATAPIWMAIFARIWGDKITKREWLGIAIGFAGIMLLNTRGSLQGDWLNAFLLMFAAASWSFGSVWGRHLSMPSGLMGAACQMLCGGVIAAILAPVFGQTWPAQISANACWAMAFLIFLGSIVAYSAYQWLLKNARPLVASSNTFVNPVVAFVVGAAFASETVNASEIIALLIILIGVVLVLTSNEKT